MACSEKRARRIATEASPPLSSSVSRFIRREPAAFERVGGRQAGHKSSGGVEGDGDGSHQEDKEQILVLVLL
jgi:hypothetical protein